MKRTASLIADVTFLLASAIWSGCSLNVHVLENVRALPTSMPSVERPKTQPSTEPASSDDVGDGVDIQPVLPSGGAGMRPGRRLASGTWGWAEFGKRLGRVINDKGPSPELHGA